MSEQRRADWLEIHEAMKRVVTSLRPLAAETIPLVDALNRVLAERILSPVYQPPWDNSAMDGYAARTIDVRSASAEQPARLLEGQLPRARSPGVHDADRRSEHQHDPERNVSDAKSIKRLPIGDLDSPESDGAAQELPHPPAVRIGQCADERHRAHEK